MANIHRHISIQGLTDILGERSANLRTRSGKTLHASRAMFDDRQADAQAAKTTQDALRQATTYANFADRQDVYINRARRNEVTAYSIALTDWLGAPKVLEIDVDAWTGEIGQTIRVKARDNVRVAGVLVVIRDAQENVLEIGEAVQAEASSAWWNYTARSHVTTTPFPTVEAIARDLPGNRDSFAIS